MSMLNVIFRLLGMRERVGEIRRGRTGIFSRLSAIFRRLASPEAVEMQPFLDWSCGNRLKELGGQNWNHLKVVMRS